MKTGDEVKMAALRLMRLALPLLDRAGETIAAARLQLVIATGDGAFYAPAEELLTDPGRE